MLSVQEVIALVALKMLVQFANYAALMTVFVLMANGLSAKRSGWPGRYRQLYICTLFTLATAAGLLGWWWVWPFEGVRVFVPVLFTSAVSWFIVRRWVREDKPLPEHQTKCAEPDEAIFIKTAALPFSQNQTAPDADRIRLKLEFAGALERGELQLHYQPQFEASSEQIRGFEALLRWDHPKLGSIPPDKFIPIAEETGWIVPIGEWVLREACRTNRLLQDTAGAPAVMSVNISAIQLQDASFTDTLCLILQESGLSPELLELEITESTLILSWDTVAQALDRLHEHGVRIALDDFGTGYSSLSYLQRLPVQLVKIDRSFIHGMTRSLREKTLVESMIRLVHNLGIRVLAEGIEKEEQLRCLQSLSCDCVQGYLLGRPMERQALPAFLQAYRERHNAVPI